MCKITKKKRNDKKILLQLLTNYRVFWFSPPYRPTGVKGATSGNRRSGTAAVPGNAPDG